MDRREALREAWLRASRRDVPEGWRCAGRTREAIGFPLSLIRSLQNRLQDCPDVFCEDSLAFRRGMNSILLIQFRTAANAIKEERNERGSRLLGDSRENSAEFFGVFGTEIRWKQHSRNEELGARICSSHFFQNRREVFFHKLGRETAEAVIGTESDNKNGDRAFEKPIDPIETVGRRVTADAGVDHLKFQSGIVDFLLQESGIRLSFLQSVTGRETVTEDNNVIGGVGHRGRRHPHKN